MPEQDQIRLLDSLDSRARADVLEEMEPDDAADLLGEMPAEQRERLLTAMQSMQADPVRRLLRYDKDTAGGLMTSRAARLPAGHARSPRCWPGSGTATSPALRRQVYVCEPPTETPTGRYLGSVHFQRLLRREPPSIPVGECIDGTGLRCGPDLLAERDLARMAAYNLIGRRRSCDDAGHLLGAVTVDDVLDRLLPPDWRRTHRTEERPEWPRFTLHAHGPATGNRSGRPRRRASPCAGALLRRRRVRPVLRGPRRFFGTGKYLVIQTFARDRLDHPQHRWSASSIHWDPYPFILLNLAFSTQAAYAAPLILLAQNRQTDRDKVQIRAGPPDREEQSVANTEYLRARGGVAADGGQRRGHPRLRALRAAGAGQGTGARLAATASQRTRRRRRAGGAASPPGRRNWRPCTGCGVWPTT
jgi:hypothetical protein